MKKNVLMLIDHLYPAGRETVAVTIARTLKEGDRYEPVFCVTRTGGELEGVLKAHDIRYRVLGRTSRFELHRLRPLWNFVREADIGVIHAHGVGSNIWASMLGRARSVPVVAHIHGGGPPVRWHALADFVTGHASHRILTVSEHRRRELIAQGLPGDRIVAVPNGIDLDRFTGARRGEVMQRLGLDTARPVVGICAALRPEKNHELFLSAAGRLTRDGIDASYVIVGGGERVDSLKALARTLEIDDRCVFTGVVRDVPDIMSTFDVGVLSSDREDLPLSILEYMASSLPVVATRVAAVPEAVDDGVTGFLVTPGDGDALADRIAGLLREPETARRMGAEGRRRAEEKFSRQAMVARITGVYDELTNG